VIVVGLVGAHVIGLVVEDRREEGKNACVRRKRVVEFVINRCEMLGRNQAEIRPHSVRPGFSWGANPVTLYIYGLGFV
jgi:hypothetical protein